MPTLHTSLVEYFRFNRSLLKIDFFFPLFLFPWTFFIMSAFCLITRWRFFFTIYYYGVNVLCYLSSPSSGLQWTQHIETELIYTTTAYFIDRHVALHIIQSHCRNSMWAEKLFSWDSVYICNKCVFCFNM